MTIEERVAVLENQSENTRAQIDAILEKTKNIERLTVAIEKMTLKMDDATNKIDRIDQRLEDVEKAPIDSYKNFKRALVNTLVSGVFGAIIGAMMTLIIK